MCKRSFVPRIWFTLSLKGCADYLLVDKPLTSNHLTIDTDML
jgi:hypothetical protein